MKVLLTAINSKYIHSSLSIRYLKEYYDAYSPDSTIEISTSEYTINQHLDDILFDIVKQNPNIVAFSCYIWNIEFITSLSDTLKKIMPNTKIILGGPEVSYNRNVLNEVNADFVIIGEGEETFRLLINSLTYDDDFSKIAGISFKQNNEIHANEQTPFDFSKTIFPYNSSFDELENKIIYYEASRGCPFSCGYCISSIEKGVRFLPIDRVFTELQFFLDKNLKQVKFVDRTFNCNTSYTKNIWQFLIENTNHVTNFHFEIAADLLNDDLFETLTLAPKGLFQFEIGVQSTNSDCLDTIQRKSNLTKLFDNVQRLQQLGNIHLHLDLIAGLPRENYDSFKNSFNEVYTLKPEQLQLGFLKLLHGSFLEVNSREFGIVYRNFAPYEVLFTNDISFSEVIFLKGVEQMLDLYYNSGRFKTTLLYLEKFFDTYFDLYEKLWSYYENIGLNKFAHNKENTYHYLFDFSCTILNIDKKLLTETILFDMMSVENLKNIPSWLNVEFSDEHKINKFYHIPSYEVPQLAALNHLSSSKRRKKTNLFKFNYKFDTFKENTDDIWTLFIYDTNISIVNTKLTM